MENSWVSSSARLHEIRNDIRREINAWCERVYELLTYSILLFSPTRPEWIDDRSRPADSINDTRFSSENSASTLHPLPSPTFWNGTIKTFTARRCVDAPLYFVEHCTLAEYRYFTYVRPRKPYTRIFSENRRSTLLDIPREAYSTSFYSLPRSNFEGVSRDIMAHLI